MSANPAAMDPLIDALGQINLQGPPISPPGSTAGKTSTEPSNAKPSDERNDDELDDADDEITYKRYRPAKLAYGRDHPDPVVENATLAAVAPPDVTYNLAMPASIICEGKLSSLQLEAVAYGCQRHGTDLPMEAATEDGTIQDGSDFTATATATVRCGFLLGDSAGMGKGRTLAGFVVENLSRGRTKHLWISVSADLYEDAKRDLADLGLGKYARKRCHSLSKFKAQDCIDFEEGVLFLTYSTLISKGRLEQVLEWCGVDDDLEEFDGLVMLDECHKCKSISLDASGKAKKGSSQTAAKVVELQQRLPRARVVYCSATSVSEPKNLAFMARLGLWGAGTEHATFNQWLDTIEELGTGAVELNAMHLKAIGALQTRQLSYETCDFALVDVVSSDGYRRMYERATEIWVALYGMLLKSGSKKTSYWAEHLRFFQYMAVAAKVGTCIQIAKQALEDGHCCVIGLQSTGEASSLRAVKAAGVESSSKTIGSKQDSVTGSSFDRLLSTSTEGLKRIIRDIIPQEQIQSWLNAVDGLELPANHLDRLLNELGGPDKVAELTGRKSRQVLRYDAKQGGMKVRYETRKLTNIQEKNAFQNGEKLIAILSEAASTGISLHADKRVFNQRRRVHVTLELPWSADKAIQQLGRTHRSNQSTGPSYKFILSDVSGEARFASAIASRLNSLGALTQGDRRATGSANALGLGTFDIDNKHGNMALTKMLGAMRKCSKDAFLDAPDYLYADCIKSIDSYLVRARDSTGNWSVGLIPYDHGSNVMDAALYNVLSRRRAVAKNRIAAIEAAAKDGQTTPVVNVAQCKEAGLNFNALCGCWLALVDVNEKDFPSGGKKGPSLVPKFLNRLLGLGLAKQRLLTDCFLSFVGNEIKSAKNSGKYDVGITTLTGRSVEFVGQPRSFCFGESVSIQVYQVEVDQGMSFDDVIEMYRNEQDGNQVGILGNIKTGFYVQQRRRLDRIFLIVNPGSSDKCVVVKPNVGRRVLTKQYVTRNIRHGDYTLIDETRAKKMWDKEFALADIPSSEDYDYGCKGRHNTCHVFAGSLIPVLNKLTSGISDYDDRQLFRVVRVETTKQLDRADLSVPSEGMVDSVDVENEPAGTVSDTDAIEIGQGAAYEMKNLGSSILRGNIIAKHEGEEKWVVEFSNGRKFKMNANQVTSSRRLFGQEIGNLVNVNMARADASSISETKSTISTGIFKPLLAAGEVETEKYERIFEEHYQGKVPATIVGIEFSKVREDGLMLWESVLRDLAKKLLSEGIQPANGTKRSP